MECFDAHLHLPTPPASQAWEAVCCGTHPEQWPQVLAWASAETRIKPALGMHPWWLGREEAAWPAQLEAALRTSRAAVGECGLDSAMKEADLGAQAEALRMHVRLARDLDRPLVLHAVRAWGALEALLKEGPLPRRVMIHAFSGSPETAVAMNRRGLYLSFSPLGQCSPRIQAALRAADPALLLLESDASEPEEQRAFPGWIEAAAACRGEAPEALAARTAENARRCFEGVGA